MSQSKTGRAWIPEGPASASASGVLEAVDRLEVPGLAGHGVAMGAGPIERRQASAEEIAAARAREEVPSALPRRSPAVITDSAAAAVSRQRGAAANRDRIAAERAQPQEEPAMVDAVQAHDDEHERMLEELPAAEAAHFMTDPPVNPFLALAVAAEIASEAHEAYVLAEDRWVVAQAELADAMGEVDAILHPPTHAIHAMPAEVFDRIREAVLDEARASAVESGPDHASAIPDAPEGVTGPEVDADATDNASAAPDPGPSPDREAQARAARIIGDRAAKAEADAPAGGSAKGFAFSRLTTHEQRVLTSTFAHDGDRKAVAAELGLTAAINVEQALDRIARKGLLPAELIAKLPARFAKYARV